MEYENPLVLSRIAESLEASNEIVDAAAMTQVLIWAEPEGEMTGEEREELTKDMKLLCAGVRVITMRTERLEMQQFADKVAEVGECYTSQSDLNRGRRKRSPRRASQLTCSTCHRHRVANNFSVRQARSASRDKRSVDKIGMKELVHLVIGHRQVGCE